MKLPWPDNHVSSGINQDDRNFNASRSISQGRTLDWTQGSEKRGSVVGILALQLCESHAEKRGAPLRANSAAVKSRR